MGSPRHIRRLVAAWAVVATICASAGSGVAGAAERSREGRGLARPSPAAGPAASTGGRVERALAQPKASAVPAAFAPLRPSLREAPALEDGALRRETGIFGSVPIPVAQIGLSPRWAAIQAGQASESFEACTRDESRCPTALHRRLRTVAAASPHAVRAVNSAVNAAIRYQTDSVAWGTEDYWASPQETMARGVGDCEDYALLKMAILSALGVPEADMTIVVVKDLSRGIGHAVLAVRTGEGFEVLDNLTDAVRRDGDISNYVPLYSIGNAGAWIHGRRRAAPLLQASSQPSPQSAPAPPGRLRGTLN